jgi:uncharacterized protein (UPF0333 family)
MRGNRSLAIALVVVAVICAVGAVILFTVKTNFLASGHPIRHTERAAALAVVAVLCLLGAFLARPRRLGP